MTPQSRTLLLLTLRFGAIALGQQADMWLAHARPNFTLRRNFTEPQTLGNISLGGLMMKFNIVRE